MKAFWIIVPRILMNNLLSTLNKPSGRMKEIIEKYILHSAWNHTGKGFYDTISSSFETPSEPVNDNSRSATEIFLQISPLRKIGMTKVG